MSITFDGCRRTFFDRPAGEAAGEAVRTETGTICIGTINGAVGVETNEAVDRAPLIGGGWGGGGLVVDT